MSVANPHSESYRPPSVQKMSEVIFVHAVPAEDGFVSIAWPRRGSVWCFWYASGCLWDVPGWSERATVVRNTFTRRPLMCWMEDFKNFWGWDGSPAKLTLVSVNQDV